MNYIPKPIDTSKIEIPASLESLVEQLSENAHEIWAKKRMDEGWRFGHHRDDVKKLTPNLVPYDNLDENEKEYDRMIVRETIKSMIYLGYIFNRNL